MCICGEWKEYFPYKPEMSDNACHETRSPETCFLSALANLTPGMAQSSRPYVSPRQCPPVPRITVPHLQHGARGSEPLCYGIHVISFKDVGVFATTSRVAQNSLLSKFPGAGDGSPVVEWERGTGNPFSPFAGVQLLFVAVMPGEP